MQIDNETKIICSLAAKQSELGALMHNAVYQHIGVNYIYVPLTISDLKGAITGIRALNIRGSSVTMPYKQEVLKYLDEIDPVAKEIGAVNTIVNDNGFLTGYNSDWIGAVEALKEVCTLKDKIVVLLGAGGAARAIAYGLKKNGSKVIIFNRDKEKARNLAEEFGLKFGGGIEDTGKIKTYDVIINATSVGFSPNPKDSIVKSSEIKEGTVAMDVVFNPIETPFLKLAKAKNCKIVPGYRMLIHQALFQIELYTGKKAPFKVMEKALVNGLKS
jgi:shikimate dehydrogenase